MEGNIDKKIIVKADYDMHQEQYELTEIWGSYCYEEIARNDLITDHIELEIPMIDPSLQPQKKIFRVI
jgi:hypothetical protein